ncbi:hypothetical protein AMTRI_Chr06g175480 [Amborella trichopoda]
MALCQTKPLSGSLSQTKPGSLSHTKPNHSPGLAFKQNPLPVLSRLLSHLFSAKPVGIVPLSHSPSLSWLVLYMAWSLVQLFCQIKLLLWIEGIVFFEAPYLSPLLFIAHPKETPVSDANQNLVAGILILVFVNFIEIG